MLRNARVSKAGVLNLAAFSAHHFSGHEPRSIGGSCTVTFLVGLTQQTSLHVCLLYLGAALEAK